MALNGYECDCADVCMCFEHMKPDKPLPRCDLCGGHWKHYSGCDETPWDIRVGHECEDVAAWLDERAKAQKVGE